jgi:hypothetical protein
MILQNVGDYYPATHPRRMESSLVDIFNLPTKILAFQLMWTGRTLKTAL